MASKNVTVTASVADADLSVGFYLTAGGTFPTDLRCRIAIKRSDGQTEVSDIALTLSGVTKPQAANVVKDAFLSGVAAKGYT